LAAAAVLIAVLGVQVVRMDNRLDTVTTAMGSRTLDQAALVAITDPAARRVHLRSDDGSSQADAVLLPDGQAYLVSRNLPALSARETYQLWAVVGDQKISVGVLGSSPRVSAFHDDADPRVLAITTEQAGGVVASEKVPALVGSVPARSA
jgi:anti-sigma-K factor RskA